jgi:bifunctional oligoribonuclease and PAP phosphatase NrnA
MQEIAREKADEILSEIKKAERILMHCHPHADADSLGSTLAMSFALQSMGKKPTIIKGDSDLPKYLSSLPGYHTIVQKNILELDLKEYDLFLILDSGSPNQITKIKELVFPLPITTIAIDHHASNTGFADINLVDNTYPATCQMVYDLFRQWNISINRDMALCLFIGMYTDTGGFRYKPTSAMTLKAAAHLAEIAPNFTDILFAMDNSNTKGRLMLQGLLFSSIETHVNDSIALASVSYQQLAKNSISLDDAAGVDIANNLKSVVGWNLGISLVELEPGIIKISMRTRDPESFDVSKLALKLGGGGHKSAAGAQIKGTIDEVKKRVLEAAKGVYDLN